MSSFDLHLHRFPTRAPGFSRIADDPEFDPARHLALESPDTHYTLDDFGYGAEIADTTPTHIAATSCFRILSDEGVAAMQHVCKQLEAFTTSNPRISRSTRGGVYRSAFLRDFALSDAVTQHLSTLMQTPLLPHAMGHQLAHLNYAPHTVGENIDKWHFDTLQVDYVMFVTDPNAIEGGEFQYFLGTRDEMQQQREAGQTIPADRIIAPTLPGPGYAVLMQGNYVVHQAKALREAGERITLVNGYSYADLNTPDYTAFQQLIHADPPATVAAEYARHMALRSTQALSGCINTPDFSNERPALEQLKAARNTLNEAIACLEADTTEAMRHFGD